MAESPYNDLDRFLDRLAVGEGEDPSFAIRGLDTGLVSVSFKELVQLDEGDCDGNEPCPRNGECCLGAVVLGKSYEREFDEAKIF